MNKVKLKSYAPQARLDFIAAVTARANLLGLSERAGQLEVALAQTQGDVTLISGQAWPAQVAAQREQLVVRMRREGFAQTCEAVAYTWFNRFAALRYMELHDYLGHGYRALSSAAGGLPDILTYASELAQAGDSGLPGLKAELVTEMKLAGHRDSDLYRMLLVAQCNALSRVMPFLFERIDDVSELLLPDNLLRSDSVIAKLVNEIPEADWAEVEIIGWLYQFYISDKKDQVIGKVVKSEDIPAATQLFTPNWIVQYLVQNSVGRLWLLANPNSNLVSEWSYYVAPVEQSAEVKARLDSLIEVRVCEDGATLSPESITVLDPACGSGHILVVAYDVMKAIYLERGYQPRVIPRLILKKNLYGLDIDDRAAQMAGFALMMKARADDRRLFSEPVNLNVLSLQESKGFDASGLTQALQASVDFTSTPADLAAPFHEFAPHDLFPESHPQGALADLNSGNTENQRLKVSISELIDTFTNAKTFGSLILIPEKLKAQLLWIKELLNLAVEKGDMYAKSAAQDLMPLVNQAQILSMKFDAVVANPPYMGSKGMNQSLKSYARLNFSDSKSDLFAMFMERGFEWCKQSGFNSMVTMHSWMFLSSFVELREKLLRERTIQTMAHLGARAFSEISGEVVQTTAFVMHEQSIRGLRPDFIRLVDGQEEEKSLNLKNKNYKINSVTQEDFSAIPGSPIAYWVSAATRAAFQNGVPLHSMALPRAGMITGNNAKFVRLWHEVSIEKIGFGFCSREDAKLSGKKWFPYQKGGAFRRWYGNYDSIVDWENDGERLRTTVGESGKIPAHAFNEEFIFKPNVNWSAIATSAFSVRITDSGCLFDAGGSAAFPSPKTIPLIAGFLNSKVAQAFLAAINPTVNFQAWNIGNLPIEKGILAAPADISAGVMAAKNISKSDWDSYETSWEFCGSPLVYSSTEVRTLEQSYVLWNDKSSVNISRMKEIERLNNSYLINAYGLQNELAPDVQEDQITLFRANREKDSQRLISYAIGCMMGRYSLDESGLIYAHANNEKFDLSRYPTFPADEDGIVPITDELWFDEDASNRIREFICAIWGVDTIEENMAWLAESFGAKSGETSDEAIRRYIADKFFKDHLQTYKKRPIYWLFSSGKQGAFQALVYLHRYNEGTLSRMRTEYVVPLTGKIQGRIEMLEKDANAAGNTAVRNKLTREVYRLKKKHSELLAYDEQLRHYADMRITLDLDDGVKVNYGKFGDLLAEVKAVAGGDSDE